MSGRVRDSRRTASLSRSRVRSRSPLEGRRSVSRRTSVPSGRVSPSRGRSSRGSPRRATPGRRSSGRRSPSRRTPRGSPRRPSPGRRSSGRVSPPRRSSRGSRSRRVSPSRTRSASGRRSRRRTSYRRSGSSSSSESSSSSPARGEGAFQMREILERLGEVERVNTKLKKKDEDKFTFTKKGCENQFKFNNKIKDIAIDRMKVELQKHFRTLPSKIDELIK